MESHFDYRGKEKIQLSFGTNHEVNEHFEQSSDKVKGPKSASYVGKKLCRTQATFVTGAVKIGKRKFSALSEEAYVSECLSCLLTLSTVFRALHWGSEETELLTQPRTRVSHDNI